MARILVADDEEGIRCFIRDALIDEGHDVTIAADGSEALALLERASYHLLLTDLKMPGLDGLELLQRARAIAPEMEAILLTAHGTIESAVQAMKLGAFDYLTKPLSGPTELRLLAGRALEHQRLKQHQPASESTVTMIATDPASRAVMGHLQKVAPTAATVLLLGESGTGKEVAARWLHQASPRRSRPFVAVNCAAVSPQLVESEMFGHERGAFTGAAERRRGRFELADGGTLFLDEVAELPAALQAKLLRVLQERSFERVGGARTISVDVRLIAATNRDLPTEIGEGRFREDLYHRLAVFPVELPPLRARPADIEPLVEHLLERVARDLRQAPLPITDLAMAHLRSHSWPGNIRELSNALERAAILSSGAPIDVEHLVLLGASPGHASAPRLDGSWKDIEREAIVQALAATGQHRKKAAERLGIGLRTLYDKIKEYGL